MSKKEKQISLLNLTLREVLENYVIVNNLECGYIYGIFRDTDIEKIFEEYNIETEYPEAFAIEMLINEELLIDIDGSIGDYNKLKRIMEHLGISKKGGIK